MKNKYLTGAVTFICLCFLFMGTGSSLSGQKRIELIEVASSQQLWTGVAVSREGRMFVNYPRWSPDVKISVGEVTGKETVKPFPDENWNNWNRELSPQEHLVCVQSVYIDNRNNLWILDAGNPFLQGVLKDAPKLLKVNLKTNNVVDKVYFQEPVVKPSSYLNDVRVDRKQTFAYISDSGSGALIVVNLKTRMSRRILDDHPSTKAENISFKVEGVEIPLKIHADGIALHPKGDFLYYQALTGRNLYRIPTDLLMDDSVSDLKLGNAVVPVACSGVADGLGFDKEGNLYITSLESNAIKRLLPGGAIETVIQHGSIKWPDSISISTSGELFFTTSQLHLGPMTSQPYKILKIKIY